MKQKASKPQGDRKQESLTLKTDYPHEFLCKGDKIMVERTRCVKLKDLVIARNSPLNDATCVIGRYAGKTKDGLLLNFGAHLECLIGFTVWRRVTGFDAFDGIEDLELATERMAQS